MREKGILILLPRFSTTATYRMDYVKFVWFGRDTFALDFFLPPNNTLADIA